MIGTPWLIFTLALVALLVFLEFKSLCIPQHCRFLFGLLIPVLGIAVCGKFFGASAVLGTAYNQAFSQPGYLLASSFTSRLILVNSIVPLACFFVSLQAFKCTSCLAYLPSSIAYSAVIYVASQFQLPDISSVLSISNINGGAATSHHSSMCSRHSTTTLIFHSLQIRPTFLTMRHSSLKSAWSTTSSLHLP